MFLNTENASELPQKMRKIHPFIISFSFFVEALKYMSLRDVTEVTNPIVSEGSYDQVFLFT